MIPSISQIGQQLNLAGKGQILDMKQIASSSTDVFACSLSSGGIVYLKTPKYSDSAPMISGALARIHCSGIRAPQVIGEPYMIDGSQFLSYMESAIPGAPITLETAGDKILTDFTADLLRLHSLSTSGYGKFSEVKGERGSYNSFSEYYYAECDYKLQAMLDKGVVDQSEYDLFLSLKPTIDHIYAEVTPTIVHGDLRREHIFVYEDQYSGMIDFGDTMSNDPLHDLAHLAVHSPELFTVVESMYRPQELDAEAITRYQQRLLLHHLYSAIKTYFYGSMDAPDSQLTRRCLELVLEDLSKFRSTFSTSRV